MANPNTEIVWGEGNWTRAQRRVVRPWVTPAIALAEEGLDYLGLQPATPKRAKILRVGRQYGSVGSSLDDFRLELCIPNRLVKRRKVGRFFTSLTATATHEMVHCVRSEGEVNEDSLLETVVSEGIAYQAEFALSQELMSEEELMREYGRIFVGLPTRLEQHLLRALLSDANEAEELRAMLEPTHEQRETADDIGAVWLDLHLDDDVALGDKLGIMAVGRLLDQGVPFGEIITMPPTDILGL